MKPGHEKPLHRIFSWENILTPVALERIRYGAIYYSFVYVFGIRVARWNSSN